MIYDLVLLIIFLIFISFFLYKNKKNLGQEGSLILYRTQWGVKLIEKIGTKYKRILNFFAWVSIAVGYLLMISIIWLIFKTVYIYFTTSIASTIKAPPVMPLIPYFPQLFGLQSIFPPFYFIYFILALIIVATVHEFSHGIFAKTFGIKIKSTGFAFFKYFPALLGAFVEQDEKQMIKAKKFDQMAILSAGVFANIITTIIFFIILIGFFFAGFGASGVIFNDYAYSVVETASIISINGILISDYSEQEIMKLIDDSKLSEIKTFDDTYLGIKGFVDENYIALYESAPALKEGIVGAITEIEGIKIDSKEKLSEELMKYSVGDKIIVKTNTGDKISEYNVILEPHPERKTGWLGIVFFAPQSKGISGKIYSVISSFKKPEIYYEPKIEVNQFIYDLIWWIILINFAVALFNMLPLGILDGGRFFYLTVLGITKSKKVAEKSFAAITYFIILLFVALMIKWFLAFF